jgi:hypothetical protein
VLLPSGRHHLHKYGPSGVWSFRFSIGLSTASDTGPGYLAGLHSGGNRGVYVGRQREPNEKLFALSSGPRLATPQHQRVIDLVSIAKNEYDRQGPGVLVMYFRDREECEDLAIDFSLALQGTPGSFPLLPKLTYELWPLDRPGPRATSSTQAILQAISIDVLMENVGTDRFALCLTIPSTSEGAADGATRALSIPYTNQGFGGVRK